MSDVKNSVNEMILPLYLGKDENGKDYFLDLVEGPHVLVFGVSGTGKTVLLKSFGETFGQNPNCEVHCFDMHQDNAECLLKKLEELLEELERRYMVLANAGVLNIRQYNDEPMPYIVFIIDGLEGIGNETHRKEFDKYVRRIFAKARAAGIHVILSANTYSAVDSTLVNNVPTVISFRTLFSLDNLGWGDATELGPGQMIVSVHRGEKITTV